MDATEFIHKALEILRAAAPDSTIILFGSRARGDAGEGSDFDFLVVEPVVVARRREMIRLSDALRPLRIPVDVLVVSKASFDKWSAVPGTVYFRAATEGKVLLAAA
ncbi:MAG: nucleotidyltransferase domain-containing protein [Deltaproteobacteria bacterium]|nr:nucleotidyltransferase domain-containing protein [Deltaproteobacteria bacterium]